MSVDIALLEDNTSDAKLVKHCIEMSGNTCRVFPTGQLLIEELSRSSFSLLIIDWELPDITGDKILHWVRQHLDTNLPVLFLTGHDSTEDIVAMLDAGADDYMTKPVNLKEMMARITALIRRSGIQDRESHIITIKPFTLDFSSHRIIHAGNEITLTPKEFELAAYLLQNTGELIPRTTLLEDIWGYGPEIQTRTIDIHISRIRRKLNLTEDNGWKLTSIYHKGYRLERINRLE